MRASAVLAMFALAQHVVAAPSANDTVSSSPPEQLFLDLPIQDVLNNTAGMDVVEPWASMYVNAIQANKFGEAVWARYHITGDVEDGIVDGTNQTVLQVIEEDAREYRVSVPELYTEALSFYAQTSSEDSQAANVLGLIRQIGSEDVSQLQKRKTYGISCSRNNLAYSYSCVQLINRMSEEKSYIGNRRAVTSYGNCYLRLGPYHGSGTDVTYWTAHAVAKLIEEECTYVPPCCSYQTTSGYSPKNSGHRKICLSRKASGCS